MQNSIADSFLYVKGRKNFVPLQNYLNDLETSLINF